MDALEGGLWIPNLKLRRRVAVAAGWMGVLLRPNCRRRTREMCKAGPGITPKYAVKSVFAVGVPPGSDVSAEGDTSGWAGLRINSSDGLETVGNEWNLGMHRTGDDGDWEREGGDCVIPGSSTRIGPIEGVNCQLPRRQTRKVLGFVSHPSGPSAGVHQGKCFWAGRQTVLNY